MNETNIHMLPVVHILVILYRKQVLLGAIGAQRANRTYRRKKIICRVGFAPKEKPTNFKFESKMEKRKERRKKVAFLSGATAFRFRSLQNV